MMLITKNIEVPRLPKVDNGGFFFPSFLLDKGNQIKSVVGWTTAIVGAGYFSGLIPKQIFKTVSLGSMILGCATGIYLTLSIKVEKDAWVKKFSEIKRQKEMKQTNEDSPMVTSVLGFTKDILYIGAFIAGAINYPLVLAAEVTSFTFAACSIAHATKNYPIDKR